MQSRERSLVEASVSTGAGFAINWTSNMLVLPLFGFTSITAGKAFWIGVVMTSVSLVRQYLIRRWFNKGDANGNTK